MSEERGLLVVISGPGAVGKDLIIDRLRQRDPRLRYSVSYTTRPRRSYEVDGEHYSFVDPMQFHELAESAELLEHADVGGYLYGTSAWRVEEAQAAGHDVILKIDVQGAESVRRRRPDGVFIFITPPTMEDLVKRRQERNSDSAEAMAQRQQLAEREMSFADRYDHVVVNDDPDRAVAEVEEILERERQRRPRLAR